MWRHAVPADDGMIVSMCVALNSEDPGYVAVSPEQVVRTLVKLREEPIRGHAVVCEVDAKVIGYALLISFWSNEMGGEVLYIDELFIEENYRGQGLGTDLIGRLAIRDPSLWSGKVAALALEVSPQNVRAKSLYERLGFRGGNLTLSRRL
jgi:ribosomal protein S18 acetylase RimI-like enzyme